MSSRPAYRHEDGIWLPPLSGETRIERLIAGTGSEDLAGLHARSIADPDWFWGRVAADLDYPFPVPYERISDNSAGVPFTRWFVGAETNVALACLRHAASRPDDVACLGLAEDAVASELSFAELAHRVGGAAAGLRGAAIGEGDRVGLFAPMSADALVAYLAIASIGAIIVPLFSGFGPAALDARLKDAEACALVSARSTTRGGREVEMSAIASASDYVAEGGKLLDLAELCHESAPFEPVLVDSEAPFLLGYTSGTTARPKGALLSHGGAGVKIASEGAYCFDMRPGDLHMWVTDMGWIMGTWSILAALANGAAVAMMEGLPTNPRDRLWRICREHGITQLGVSPTLTRALREGDEAPPERPSMLRAIGSTGEPLDEASWRWLFEGVGDCRIPIVNISGGTEVGAALLSPTPVTPLAPSTVGTPALGLDLAIVDREGKPVAAGEVGELVCRNAWPGMTRGLWRSPERFIEAYWSQFPGVWAHGDWASRDEHGLWFILGRSDDTINVAGKRVAPAEVEQVIAGDADVHLAAVVGLPHTAKGESIWAFVVPAADRDPELGERLRTRVARTMGASFRPERVILVPDLPRTRSQKVARRVVRAVALGEDPGDASGLDNPEAADLIDRALRSGVRR